MELIQRRLGRGGLRTHVGVIEGPRNSGRRHDWAARRPTANLTGRAARGVLGKNHTQK